MRLTFRAERCATWAEAADWAAAGGYDGVGVRFSFDAADRAATNVRLADPAKVRRALGEVAVSVVTVAVGELPSVDPVAAVAVAVATAGQLASPIVRVVESAIVLSTDALRRLGDRADAAGVTLAVGSGTTSAVALWHRLDAVGHPAVAAAWDAAAADDPAVAVPTLNSRIRVVRLDRPPTVPGVRVVLQRLAGVGYAGPFLVDWDESAGGGGRPAAVAAANRLRP